MDELPSKKHWKIPAWPITVQQFYKNKQKERYE